MRETVLKKMDKCSGCGLCEIVCPVHAVKMRYNKKGFLYPTIQKEKCINCGLCEKRCPVENISVAYPITCYAGVNLNPKTKEKSSSGGMFAALAEYILEHGGVVFGAAIVPKGNIVTVKHTMIKDKAELKILQGSKYVQSDARECYPLVKQQLLDGKKVLFSGTPCQVSAIKSYLENEYENLLLVDLICHGTPSTLHWEESLQEKIISGERISEVSFRGPDGYMQGKIEIETKEHQIRKEKYNFENDHYCAMFLAGDSYRESCYQCQYARLERSGDITIGDFWGFEKIYNQDQLEKSSGISLKNGISLVSVNTEKGQHICDAISKERMWFYKADYKKAVQHNPQLSHPSKKRKNRFIFLTLYRTGGWKLISSYRNIKIKVKNIIVHNGEKEF